MVAASRRHGAIFMPGLKKVVGFGRYSLSTNNHVTPTVKMFAYFKKREL